MISKLFDEWNAWATDRLTKPRSPAAAHSYEYWLELKVASLTKQLEKLDEIQEASIEFYCGVIDKSTWRKAVCNSPEGKRLIALANA